jgi:hypothetical protein
MVAAMIGENSKLASLPSDAARLGYFYVVLGKAKLQRPSGQFSSRNHWREVAGRFAKFLSNYIAAGLVEEAPNLCGKCAQKWPGLAAGSLIVHDWHDHQSDPGAAERAQEWRRDHAGDDEPGIDWDGVDGSSNADQTPIERGMNADQTAIERSLGVHSRAGARREHEQEHEQEGLTVGVGLARTHARDDADPAFPLRQWLSAHGAAVRDGDGYHRKLVQLVATDGGKTCRDVIAAFEQLRVEGAHTAKQYVMSAEDLLFPTLRPKANGKAPSIDAHKYDHLVEEGDDFAAPDAMDTDYIGGAR